MNWVNFSVKLNRVNVQSQLFKLCMQKFFITHLIKAFH